MEIEPKCGSTPAGIEARGVMAALPSTSISLVFPHPFARRLPGGPRSATPFQHGARAALSRSCWTLHTWAQAPFSTGTAQVATQAASGAVGCHLAARKAEASSRPGQRPSASAADWSTLPFCLISPAAHSRCDRPCVGLALSAVPMLQYKYMPRYLDTWVPCDPGRQATY